MSHNIVFHDKNWQYPAITEQHAFEKAQALLPTIENVAYFAFPWATLIDKYTQHAKDSVNLQEALGTFVEPLKPYKKVVTVCQHIFMLKFQNVFAELGVTDIFWSHAIKGQPNLPNYPHIRIHPFPLYPVQAVDLEKQALEKKYLFSFIGAKVNHLYLSNTRSLILGLLANHPKGYIKSRDQWHYETIVYEQQIRGKAQDIQPEYQDQSQEFQKIMQQSIFALCPSGTGSNSIRLWEAISMGVIPVVLADTYLSPVEQQLWEQAVVICEETEAAIRALPERLEKLAQNENALQQKREALKQIAATYGTDVFIHDIQMLFSQYEKQPIDKPLISAQNNQGTPDWLLNFTSVESTATCQIFLSAFNSYALLETDKLKHLLKNNPQLRQHVQHCLQHCNTHISQTTKQVNKLKQLGLV